MAPARLAHKEGSTRSHPRDMEASPCILFTYKQANYPSMQSGLLCCKHYSTPTRSSAADLTIFDFILPGPGIALAIL